MNDRGADNSLPILDIQQLSVAYVTETGLLDTVRQVSLRIGRGEVYGLVGESGSGKTTLANAVVRYLPGNGRIQGGRVLLNDVNLLELSGAQLRHVWGAQVGLVPQSPRTSVNPSIVIGEQIAEVARVHLGMSQSEAWHKAIGMLVQVGMPDPETVAWRYAHQLSGGMLQRVLIAMALTTNPQLLIMDEPTTGLDVTTEAVILDLIQELLEQYQSAVLYITHNLGVVARICDWVGVMYAGELLEDGPVQDVFKHSLHPYALGLLGCVPRLDANKDKTRLHTIPGYIPRPDELPGGCVFAPRCILAEEACRQARPPLVQVSPRHWTACRRWPEVQADRTRFVRVHERSTQTAAVHTGPVVLEAIGVKKFFKTANRMDLLNFSASKPEVRAVDDISILSRRSLTVGIVGESGCGKTTLARCIVGLEEPTAGEVKLEEHVLPPAVAQRPRPVLKKLQMVFQNPDASLNPQHTVAEIIGRPLVLFRKLSGDQVSARVSELLEAVNLPTSYLDRLPHELSGGEKQRVAIARAFAAEPVVLICDEPISALDVSVQASLINLLVELQNSKGTAYLFISHDLSAVRHISDWIVIVYLGRLWEVGPAAKVFAPPMHPYTEALLSAIPIPDPDARQERIRLQGSVPSAVNIPSGCRFHTRCPRKIGSICETEEPPWQDDGPDHRICCHIPLITLRELQKGVLQLAASQDEFPAAGRSPGE